MALMACLSLLVRWLEEAYKHVMGMVPGLICEAGFTRVEETGRYTTAFGRSASFTRSHQREERTVLGEETRHPEGERRLLNRVHGSSESVMWSGLLDRRFTVLFGLAVIVNYPWERAQSSLYVLPGGAEVQWWMCAVASVADGLAVLVIFQISKLVIGQRNWYLRPGARGYAVLLLSGAVISIVVEWITIHVTHWWAYSPRMPLVPGLNIGLAPLAQMLVLPPLIVTLLSWWERKMRRREQCDG